MSSRHRRLCFTDVNTTPPFATTIDSGHAVGVRRLVLVRFISNEATLELRVASATKDPPVEVISPKSLAGQALLGRIPG